MKIENADKNHWENIFQNKDTSKVSWFQDKPTKSLDSINKHIVSKSQAIIDIGGGDSRLPDGLIDLGYKNITVLDISEYALEESKKRLGNQSMQIHWVVSNVLDFEAKQKYNLWHDRAMFHFITDRNNQLKYKERIRSGLAPNGIVIIAAFSKNEGPEKCCRTKIQQHDRASIRSIFQPEFKIIDDFEDSHETPSESKQNFYWSILKLAK